MFLICNDLLPIYVVFHHINLLKMLHLFKEFYSGHVELILLHVFPFFIFLLTIGSIIYLSKNSGITSADLKLQIMTFTSCSSAGRERETSGHCADSRAFVETLFLVHQTGPCLYAALNSQTKVCACTHM